MRCKACNKTMDTPANWLNPEKEDEDMCAACIKSSETDWDVKEYAFGKFPKDGLTIKPPNPDTPKDWHSTGRHGMYQEPPVTTNK